MKRMFLVLLLLSTFGLAYSEENTMNDEKNWYNFGVTIKPVALLLFPVINNFALLNLNMNIQVVAGNGYFSISPEFQKVFSSFDILLDFSYRFVLNPNPIVGKLDGFYIAPGLNLDYAYISTASVSGFVISPIADIGYQWNMNGFLLDIGAGIGMRTLTSLPSYITSQIPQYFIRLNLALGAAF